MMTIHSLIHRDRLLRWLAVIALASGSALTAHLSADQRVEVCRFNAGTTTASSAAPGDDQGAPAQQYAPDRLVDVLHVTIDVTPDFAGRTIAGTTTLRFSPIAKPLSELKLDAVDLTVKKVEASTPVQAHQVTQDAIIITFAKPIPAGKEATVTVTHSAQPREGLYFRTPQMGYKPGDTHLWTQGEPQLARHWFPSYDYPNERFTTEMICHVPKDMTVLSNGRKADESIDAGTGLKRVRWVQEKPHVNYLIALAAGYFKAVTGKHGDVPLAFYTPASQIEYAANSFKDTADMMAFYEKETGTAYPWAKYYQVVVDDFSWGGMENTTLTVLNDYTLHPADTEPNRTSQGLIAHELAHQWFGDYVTCKDWSHIWLNEGFATFYAHLYDEHKNGRDSMLYGLYRDARRIFANKDDTRPIVFKGYEQAQRQFDLRAYQKGGWVLHMLRTQLGPALYRKCIKTYLKRHGLQTAETADLSQVFAELSGLSLQRFFDQWVYHGGFPQLRVSQSWDQKTKLAKVAVRQTQATNDKVLLFSFPVKLRFTTEKGVVERQVTVDAREHDFYVPLPAKPTIVRFDSDLGVLADVTFDKPNDMLFAQLADGGDVVGRLRAIDALKAKDDQATVDHLAAALRGDGFYGVRIEASKALRQIHNDAAFAALAASMDQADGRVRQQVVEDIAGFYRPEALAALLSVIKSQKNIDVVSEAVQGLGRYAGDDVHRQLLHFLTSDSYRNALAVAAIGAIRTQDDPDYVKPLLAALKTGEQAFRSRDFGRALNTLAYIARNLDDRDEVRRFIAGYVNHPKRSIQIAAIGALGALRDPKAIAVVDAFTAGPEDDPVRKAADEAVKTLSDAKTVPVALKDLRDEVLALKKQNEKLRKDVDELKKRLDSGTGAGTTAATEGKKEK